MCPAVIIGLLVLPARLNALLPARVAIRSIPRATVCALARGQKLPPPPPPESFQDLGCSSSILEALVAECIHAPMEAQYLAFDVLRHSQTDVALVAEAGSGKTLAYLVPLLEHLSKYSLQVEKISRDKGTYCVIFSPTRELCTQIEVEMQKLLKLFNYVLCSTIMGGENPKKEKAKLRKGLTVVVCTPGRLLYHLQNTQNINFSRL
ncbi:MAG: DEAD/DEAH box helicase [Proteobacteria bacterium]|nr:DEAD/DEAH box helicase [Pseudomonadota bacterium]